MTTIKNVPMVTDDGIDIELNAVVFTADWSTGYDFKKEGQFKIEAHRVISVDNTRRFFRTRCIKGCETEHQFSKGCSRQRIYGKIESAKEAMNEEMKKDLIKCESKIKKISDTRVYIRDKILELKGFASPRVPKAVSIG